MIFKASLDKLAFGITYIFIPITFIAAAVTIYLSLKKNHVSMSPTIGLLLVVLFFLLIYIFTYLFSPVGYEVKNNSLIISRQLKSIVIPLSSIKEIYPVDNSEMKGSIRTFGSGGLFGYYGHFYSKRQGKMAWYTTQRKNFVVIITSSGKKIVITPDDLSFIDAVKKY